MHKNGFTLLEILLSTLILALVMAGLVNIFVSAKKFTLHTRSRMQAAELGKLFLDPLQMQVREGETVPTAQDGWDEINNLLRIPAANESRSWSGAQQNLNNIPFTPNYTVSRVRDGAAVDTGLRRVKVDINWNELLP